MDLFFELIKYFKTRKKYWLLPVFIILFFIGFLIFFTTGTAIAPFIYTIF